MYYVEQKYYDNGKTEIRILQDSEAFLLGYCDGYCSELPNCDLYVETFDDYEKANDWCKQATCA